MVAAELVSQLEMWKKYCIRHCFRVPDGFAHPKRNQLSVRIQCLPSDPDLDAELESLREKVTKAGKESAELTCELQALEIQSTREDH